MLTADIIRRDYNKIDFSGYEHPEWVYKKDLAVLTRAAFKGKTIAVYTGAFLEILASPFGVLFFTLYPFLSSDVRCAAPALGYDFATNSYNIVGPASTKVAITSLPDIGRAVARASILALDPAVAARVPDEIRIAGSNLSTDDIVDKVTPTLRFNMD